MLKFKQFKAEMLVQAISQAKLLCEMSILEDIKIEPEQLRQNIGSILSLLIETEDVLRNLGKNCCSSSEISISE